MVDKKISELDSNGTLDGTETTVLVQSGGNVKALLSSLSIFFNTSNINILNWTLSEAFVLVSATRNADNVITTASVKWPDGTSGTFTTTTINTTFNTIDAYTVTYVGSTTKTVTQAEVTRNDDGAVIAQPELTIS
jgi:hypothetical protein